MSMRSIGVATALFAGTVSGMAHSAEQGYPVRPIRVIVAQSAGSATDVAARVIGQQMTAVLGQQVVIDNRAGAGGMLGTELAAKASADGYTLLFANISTHGVNPAVYAKLPYDAVKDFAPISRATSTPNVLLVNPSVPAKSAQELIAHLKARPGAINIATPGNGSSQHLATELFKSMAGGLKALHVPYKGSGPAMTALISGEAAVMIPTLTLSMPHIRSQKVRALAVTSAARLDHMPGVPTLAETLPGFEVLSWYGYVAPAGTPAAPISRLNAAIAKVLAMPDTRKGLAAVGMNTESSTPAEFGAFIKAELAKWGKVAREANLKF